MTEMHVYYSRVVHELAREPLKSKQKERAQLYLIQGCTLANKKLIDISLSFGANLLLPDKNGVSPIQILREKEKVSKKLPTNPP
jgi:hypothetical protein